MFSTFVPLIYICRSYQTNCRSYIAGNGLVFLYKRRGIIFSTCGEELCSLHALKVERIVISLECFGKNCNLYRSKVEKENVSSKWCAMNSVNCYEVVESNLNYTLPFFWNMVCYGKMPCQHWDIKRLIFVNPLSVVFDLSFDL